MMFSTYGGARFRFSPHEFMNLAFKSGRDFYEVVMYSSVFVGLAAIGMVYTSCLLQGIPITPPVACIMFLTSYSVYNLNRKTDEDEDAINHMGRYSFTKRHEGLLFWSAILAYLLALLLAAISGISAAFIALIPLFSGILYSIKLLPARYRYRRLKDVPVMKNLLVGFAWSSMLSLLPVALMGGEPDGKTLVVFLMFFSYAFIASTIPDIRDRTGDAQAGVMTIPVLLGEERTRDLLVGFNLLFCLPLIAISLGFPLIIPTIILATMVYCHVCLRLLGKSSVKQHVYDLLADGQYLFFGSALFLINSTHILPPF
jgi:4-hydroxybenzoate polyprenyltransferase